jgi:hypothetical protein
MTGPDALIGVRISRYHILRMTGVISDAGPAKRKHDEAHRQEGSYYWWQQWHRSCYSPTFHCGGHRSPLLVATRRRSMKKNDEGQALTALELGLPIFLPLP